jgi:hypothetical protein
MLNVTTTNLYFIGFILGSLLHIIINNYLGYKIKSIYFKKDQFTSFLIILFIIFMIILIILNLFDITLFNIINNDNYFNNNSFNMVESSGDSTTQSNNTSATSNKLTSSVSGNLEVAEGSVNINNPNIGISIPKSALNNMVSAGSTYGGVAAGIKIAQTFGSTPATKLGLGLATVAVTQASTAVMSNYLNNSNNSNNLNNTSNNYINNLNSDNSSNNLPNNILNEFPYNNLPHMDLLVNTEILLLSILFNLFIVHNLTQVNYLKYIPDNKFGNLLNIIINKYISIWSISNKFILIYTWILLFICVIISKICLYSILNY